MGVFKPKGLAEVVTDMQAQVLALAPITSVRLGKVVDNIIFSLGDEVSQAYTEMVNALGLLRIESRTGSELDLTVSEYPGMPTRYQATNATGKAKVTDPNITKISTLVLSGGAMQGDDFINASSTADFPASGTLLVGTRGETNFETVTYTGKLAQRFTGCSLLLYDHAASESLVLTTVGDRTFPGPYAVGTEAIPGAKPKNYKSTTALVIYDGDAYGYMDIIADNPGEEGNTPSGSITRFLGTKPFPEATITNDADIDNGRARESDAELRERIKRRRQSLSSANVDAIVDKALGTALSGQSVVFAQLVEDPDPTLPGILYIDDGAAFTPTTESISSPITLVSSAIGGERRFHLSSIDPKYRPLVTTDLENVTRIFSAIEVKKNNVVIDQGDDPDEYRIQPDYGFIRLNMPLSSGDELIVSALTYYVGLIGEVNKSIYGLREDRENYPGAAGFGSWVQVRNPQVQYITIQGSIILDGSRDRTEIITEMKNNFMKYINGLGIGVSVVASRLRAIGFVRGMISFNLTQPADNIVITDGVLSRLVEGNISIT